VQRRKGSVVVAISRQAGENPLFVCRSLRAQSLEQSGRGGPEWDRM